MAFLFSKKSPKSPDAEQGTTPPTSTQGFSLIQHSPIDMQSRKGDLRGTAPLFFGYLVGVLYLSILFMGGNLAVVYWNLQSHIKDADAQVAEGVRATKEIKRLAQEFTKSEGMKTTFEAQQKWLNTVYPSNEIYRRLFAAVPLDKFTITALELKLSDLQPDSGNSLRFDLVVRFQSSGEDTANLSRFLQNCNAAHLALENTNNKALPEGVMVLTASILVNLPLLPDGTK